MVFLNTINTETLAIHTDIDSVAPLFSQSLASSERESDVDMSVRIFEVFRNTAPNENNNLVWEKIFKYFSCLNHRIRSVGNNDSIISDSLNGIFYGYPIGIVHIETILLQEVDNLGLEVKVYQLEHPIYRGLSE